MIVVIIAWLLLGTSSQFVFCFGTDGHIELETAILGHCCPIANHHPNKTVFPPQALEKKLFQVQKEPKNCGACLDHPLAAQIGSLMPSFRAHSSYSSLSGQYILPFEQFFSQEFFLFSSLRLECHDSLLNNQTFDPLSVILIC